MDKSSLGNRMKSYEDVVRVKLTKRMPCIIRIDGKAFHSYTRGFDKPLDDRIQEAMILVSEELLKNIQGAKIIYTQSDEISILLNDYEKFDTQSWFDKNLQKMVSVSASIASAYFNQYMLANYNIQKIALFDSRAFVIPREEVSNYFLWRYQDCVRNSISSLAQSMFSTKQLHGKNMKEMKEMIKKSGGNWDNCLSDQKYGIYILPHEFGIIKKSETFDKIKSLIENCLVQKEI